MANQIVPKSRIQTGPGVLYRSALGTLIPGQTSASVSNKAVTAGVATLTTAAAHGFIAGDKIFVNIADAVFDGQQTVVAAPTATTLTFNVSTTTVASVATTGTILSYKAGGTVAGGKFTDSWGTGWTPVGATKEGSVFSWSPSTENIEVAEYLLPLSIVTTSVEAKLAFEIAEMTAYNWSFALNGGAVSTVSGTGATLLTELAPPNLGSEIRYQIGWESDQSNERLVAVQCFQVGELSVSHAKGSDYATLSVEFGLENPSAGPVFRRFYAGATPVGTA